MRSRKYQAILDGLAREYRNAPIEEWNYTHRDVFTRHYEQVSVELCHGEWRTFRRGSDGIPGHHQNREAAKTAALQMLGI